MPARFVLKCIICEKCYEPGVVEYTCPDCGDERGLLDFEYDYAVCRTSFSRASLSTHGNRTIGRYLPLLPLQDRVALPPLEVGWTPLYEVPALARLACVREVRVKDEGVGIPPEDLDKVFRLYYTTKANGSGIGLSLVYRIVQMHDGQIDVASVVGRGTTMILLLPLAPVPAVA